jgi:PAS domain S-box-containing protein
MKRHTQMSISGIRFTLNEIFGGGDVAHDFSAEEFSDEKFRLAVESCPNGILMTDGDGVIVLANSEAERLFGYLRRELIGQSIENLVPERMRDRHLAHRAWFARHPGPRRLGASCDLFGLRRDGSEFPLEVSLNPIDTRQGLLVVSVVEDIGDRKRMDRLKDEFVSTVSHELRAPLTSISGSLGLLIGGAAGTLPEPALRLLTIAQTNSQRLVRLINDILDIEKIESGQVDFNFKRTDLRALVEQMIEANRSYADAFGVRIRLNAASTPAEVHADPDRLAQVITNLLSNAIKFSPLNGEVVVAIGQDDNVVRITVRDHGSGIPPLFKPRVFEKFSQADAPEARRKDGTGLGLSIVKQIVTRLGGKVGFDDAAGGGTVFHVELPSWAKVAKREVDVESPAAAPRILLCEDDPDAAMSLRDGLRPVGFGTDFAHTRADAIARAQVTPYAAILVDFELPESEGDDLIRRLRQLPESSNTPIVIMSAGNGWNMESLGAPHFNVVECIEKPVDIDRLAQILDRAAVRQPNGLPHILHVDDDREVLDLVARTLGATASLVSVESVAEARRALEAHHFDLAILDIALGMESGIELLPDLSSRKGGPIPVIIFAACAAEICTDAQIDASLDKTDASLDDLIATVHDRLTLTASLSRMEVG